jgi:ubiquinone/menaquinone biosynthesis C-methylase UbiE
LNAETTEAQGAVAPPKNRKGYKGLAMEGFIARWYSKTTQKNVEQYKSYAKLVADHVPEGSRVLEVAPGPGYLSVELAKLGNYKIVGLDISKTFVQIASERAKAANVQAEFRQGDVAYMPFANETFDFAICTAAFKNFTEPVRAIEEIFRVLKRGSSAVILDLRKDVTKAEINEAVDEMGLSRINSFVTKFTFKHGLVRSAYTKDQLRDLVSKTRFRTCDIVDDGIGLRLWLRRSRFARNKSKAC